MKRRILLVDDEVAVLLTMKAVLEISGFEVETAASAREGKLRLRSHEYHMVITDMRMENDEAGREVIRAARTADYHPAVALLTAFPVDESDWQGLGADQLLLKPMHTRVLLDQIEKLFAAREQRLASLTASEGAKSSVAPKHLAAKKRAAPAKPTKKSSPVRAAAAKKSASSKKVSGPVPKTAVQSKIALKAAAGKTQPKKSAKALKKASKTTSSKKSTARK